MITGIGLDIISIDRVNKSMQNDRFLHKIFTNSEIDYISQKTNSAQTAAGMFCAKEAVLKALGIGITQTDLRNIEIMHDVSGAPSASLHSALATSSVKLWVSISHDGDHAIAQAIAERLENK